MHKRPTDPWLGQRWKSGAKVAVVAVYEDDVTRDRVDEFCRYFNFHQLPQTCTLTVDAWLFNLLRSPKLTAIATNDAALADLIIISAHRRDLLPDEVKDWMRSCLSHRGKHPPVVLALLDPGAPEPESPTEDRFGDAVKNARVKVITSLAA